MVPLAIACTPRIADMGASSGSAADQDVSSKTWPGTVTHLRGIARVRSIRSYSRLQGHILGRWRGYEFAKG